MNRYGLHGKLQASEGNGEQLAAILLKASELVSTAPGCRLYLISQDQETPDAVWGTEVWDTEADHDNALKVEGVKELISQAMPILAGPPSGGQKLSVLGGFGI